MRNIKKQKPKKTKSKTSNKEKEAAERKAEDEWFEKKMNTLRFYPGRVEFIEGDFFERMCNSDGHN